MKAKKQTGSVTRATSFGLIPAAGAKLFEVRGGIDYSWARSTASCLVDGVKRMCDEAIDADGMTVQNAYICSFIMDAVEALIDSMEEKA